MFKKRSKSERSFSIMLAEEILRAELKRLYGDKIKFFQCDIVATQTSPAGGSQTNISNLESRMLLVKPRSSIRKRTVKISAIIGPFEWRCPTNPSYDRSCNLRHVEAECRIFCFEESAVYWQPHFLIFTVYDYNGCVKSTLDCYYEDGKVDGEKMAKNNKNPCQDMVDSQVPVHYPSINPELHSVA